MSALIRTLFGTAALVALTLPARAQLLLELSTSLVACADQKDVEYGKGAYQACLANERNATPWLIENWDRLTPSARDLCVKANNVPGGAMFYAVCIATVTKRETKDATVAARFQQPLALIPACDFALRSPTRFGRNPIASHKFNDCRQMHEASLWCALHASLIRVHRATAMCGHYLSRRTNACADNPNGGGSDADRRVWSVFGYMVLATIGIFVAVTIRRLLLAHIPSYGETFLS